MIKSDATDTVKRRLNYNKICPVCGTEIKDFQDFQYVVFKRGVNKCYRFFHTFCLVDSSEDREFFNVKEG